MADVEYDYTISPVAVDALTQQIQQSSIVTALDYVNAFGSAVSIFFKATLSTGDKAVLDAVVAAHTGIPLLQTTGSPVSVVNSPNVTTLYELNDKDLKLARGVAEVDSTSTATIVMKIPGTAGSGNGRYIEGGYATTEDYDKDDYALVWVSDDDRLIAWQVALVTNPSATAPVADSVIQGMGVIPAVGVAMPSYPIIKNFYDEEAPVGNQGWYFWPVAQGSTLPPCGETEVEAIAGWAFCPSGFYLKIKYCRATLTTGGIRINFWWAKETS